VSLPRNSCPPFFIPSLDGTVPEKYQLEALQPITMTLHVNDLRIAEEIRPIFDSTHNDYSAQALTDLLAKPLSTKEEIWHRQDILKGFIANKDVWKDYSFYRFDLSDVYEFFDTIFVGSVSPRKMGWKFFFSEKTREQKKGKLILMVRLFYALSGQYLEKINVDKFPALYAVELEGMKKFLADFNLEYYEHRFTKNKFRVRQMVELMMKITEKVAKGEMALFWQRWFLFEAYLSISNCILERNFAFPEFDDDQFMLAACYHPVLKNPVKNDFNAHRRVNLLTGPNMSGKSTFLKSVSLCVYLAHTGFAVPAARAVLPFFESISVAINLTDSIVTGYSHFMTEIMTLKNVLTDAERGTKCFAVFDELFRGTNIEDALEISTTTIRGFQKYPNSLFLISTHLHQLKEMDEIKNHQVATWYIDCQMKGDTPIFTYELKQGWNDLRLGRILFETEGLDKMLQVSNHR
jgi:DNA mismatch repair protein MutS